MSHIRFLFQNPNNDTWVESYSRGKILIINRILWIKNNYDTTRDDNAGDGVRSKDNMLRRRVFAATTTAFDVITPVDGDFVASGYSNERFTQKDSDKLWSLISESSGLYDYFCQKFLKKNCYGATEVANKLLFIIRVLHPNLRYVLQ